MSVTYTLTYFVCLVRFCRTCEKMSSSTPYLVIARFASLGKGFVTLQRFLPQQVELLHVHQLKGQVQRSLQLLYLKKKTS